MSHHPASTTSFWNAAAITADTALRLSRFFGTTAQFWLNLQDAYDIGRMKPQLAHELEQIEPLKATGATP